MPEENVTAADMAACDCEPCKRKDGLAHNVRAGIIHSYSSTPRNGWRPRYTARETELRDGGQRFPTFGIELETSAPTIHYTNLPDCPVVPYLPWDATPAQIAERAEMLRARNAWDVRNDRHRERQRARQNARGHIRADEAVSLASPRGFWHAKHDGSVTGPEFASQPATLAYWRAQRAHIAGMLRSLLHGGMRSHDGDTCGMHVNIGTDAFDNAAHLARFAKLVYVNPRWSTRMSQRTNSSVSHWSRFDDLTTDGERMRWAEEVFRYGYSARSRYIVLNASNSGRIEFRLPRGTLRFDRFMAKLEWTAAMIEYTRDGSNVVQVSPFMRWVQRTGEYPALLTYMQERFDAARFEGDDPEPPQRVTPEPRVPPDPDNAPDARCGEANSGLLCTLRPGHPDGHYFSWDAELELAEYSEQCGDLNRELALVCTRRATHVGNHAATDIPGRLQWPA
jgi:hypothetical protein